MQPVIKVEPRALERLLEIRRQEPDADELGLVLAISGVSGTRYSYEMALMLLDPKPEGVHLEDHGGLTFIIPEADIENLRGAEVKMSRDLLNPGLVLENPNTPSPQIAAPGPLPELDGPIADRVVQVVTSVINPAIASHGGVAEVVAVEEGTVYVRLGGGCQGCGMATVTLSQGIESTLTQMVPEVKKVVDVTDHAHGTNPYYEQAKK
ncbi:MAG: NifU family protein [Acidimicrobiia bacterium]|nr:NifU family protein [Acidimicrobiia bacterium]NNL69422.1 iron-sulfur cluster assembly accessory protein [Acidimicrobiia bacterium]